MREAARRFAGSRTRLPGVPAEELARSDGGLAGLDNRRGTEDAERPAMERRDLRGRGGGHPGVIRAALATGGAVRAAVAAVLVGALLTSVLEPFAGARRRG